MEGTNILEKYEVIDTHVHLIYPDQLKYGWAEWWPHNHISKPESKYLEEHKNINIKGILFMEVSPCDNYEEEAKLVESLSEDKNTKIIGVIAHIPMKESLEFIKKYIANITHPNLIGFRYMTHSNTDHLNPDKTPEYLEDSFIEKLDYIGELNLPFHISGYQQQLTLFAKMIEKCPRTTFLIEDLGKCFANGEDFQIWYNGIEKLAKLENVYFKLSPGFVYPNNIMRQAKPYIETALKLFGVERLAIASDWGITNIVFQDWLTFLYEIFSEKGLKEEDIQLITSKNALKLFNLNLK
jgi:predicted TIM-barrel fold metal-dependent hydrolase